MIFTSGNKINQGNILAHPVSHLSVLHCNASGHAFAGRLHGGIVLQGELWAEMVGSALAGYKAACERELRSVLVLRKSPSEYVLPSFFLASVVRCLRTECRSMTRSAEPARVVSWHLGQTLR